MADPSQRRKRRIALLLVAVAGVLFSTRWWPAPDSEPAPLAVAASAEPAPSPAPSPPTDVATAPPPEPAPEPAPPAIRRFLELNRYPTSSRPLTADSIDLLEPGRRYEQRQPLGDDAGDGRWEVHLTADRYALLGEETATISLSLWHAGEPVQPQAVELMAEHVDGGAEPIRLTPRRNGTGYQALFEPEARWPDHLGEVQVTARFSAPDLRPQTGRLAFYFTGSDHIPGRFSGEIGDRLTNGDLVVEVGVEVDTPGLYRIEANLHDRHGTPIAWARYQGELAKGTQTAPLAYHGLIFHEADAKPPFVLRQLRGYRMRPGDSPHREDLPTPEGEWAIRDQYILADFRRTEHQSAHKQRMVELYENALERGVRLSSQ